MCIFIPQIVSRCYIIGSQPSAIQEILQILSSFIFIKPNSKRHPLQFVRLAVNQYKEISLRCSLNLNNTISIC